MKPVVLAVSASLRNARWGKGTSELLERIRDIKDQADLYQFVQDEAQVHYEQFLEAGRNEGLAFDELYRNLRKLTGRKGLCNSEVGMVVALWAAYQVGCEIDYIPLANFFDSSTSSENLIEIRNKILAADGLLMCTPVYFGDRSSLANDFINFLTRDEELREAISGKPVAGVVVGAKRNGGQETTLIYQLNELRALGMMALGNDSETTSQYGGTLMAGDVGTAARDEYGLNTALGTGRRLGRVSYELNNHDGRDLNGKLRVSFWILQDANGYALNKVRELVKLSGATIEAKILNLAGSEVKRCKACDICPTHLGADNEYRCIIKNQDDPFSKIHEDFLDQDLIVPVTLSLNDITEVESVYQRFIERTRYLRRGDYLFTDVAILPLVFEELGSSQNMQMRMLTSLIRHHTVILKPIIGFLHENALLNEEQILETWQLCLEQAKRLAIGRLFAATDNTVVYNPVGYVLSAAAAQESDVAKRRMILQKDREQRRIADAQSRLSSKAPDRAEGLDGYN